MRWVKAKQVLAFALFFLGVCSNTAFRRKISFQWDTQSYMYAFRFNPSRHSIQAAMGSNLGIQSNVSFNAMRQTCPMRPSGGNLTFRLFSISRQMRLSVQCGIHGVHSAFSLKSRFSNPRSELGVRHSVPFCVQDFNVLELGASFQMLFALKNHTVVFFAGVGGGGGWGRGLALSWLALWQRRLRTFLSDSIISLQVPGEKVYGEHHRL
jgi:hypothetical protein